MPRRHEVIPSANRLATTLRDLGYEFVTAVADLVDNCIAANASVVNITMRFEGAESWIRIADDGDGMDANVLTEAMRYGSLRDYGDGELGKFGLGLKSASTSQCKRLTVASRNSESQRRIYVRCWDLDDVEVRNKWEVSELDPSDAGERLTGPLEKGPGTVVLWEKLDRVLDFKIPNGEFARKGFLQRAEQLELHLRMVFHRFLNGEVKGKKRFSIELNGSPLVPWDPFVHSEKVTVIKPESIDLVLSNGVGTVTYRPFILPTRDGFSSPKAFHDAAGPEKWNRQQGFYIYRNSRLIQAGGWSHMRAADEHTKYARAGLEFSSSLDEAFKINLAKERVNLPLELRDRLKPHVETLARRARESYKPDKDGAPAAPPSGPRARPSPPTKPGSGPSPGHQPPHHPSLAQALSAAATAAGESASWKRIVASLRKLEPGVADELGV